MTALSRIPDGSHLPTIDATDTFDRRLGIEKTVKQLRKQLGIRGAFRVIIPPRRPGGAYREIRSDGRKYYQLEMSVWDPTPKPRKGTRKKATRRTTPRAPAFLWRGWPPRLK